MIVLKYVSSLDNSIEAYNALHSAVKLKKEFHKVILLCNSNSFISENCKKFRIDCIELGVKEKVGFLKIPYCDVIDIYDFKKSDFLILNKILNYSVPKFLRIYSFPDKGKLEFIRKNYSKVNALIVPSVSIKDELVFNGIPENTVRIFNPLLAMPRWESAKQIKPATFLQRPYRISYIYRNKRYESMKFFLDIAAGILDKVPNVNFMLVGPKDERIRNYARDLNISHKVDMLGIREDMPEVMAMTHIYVKIETEPYISRSLMEAMASSLVCVVPDIRCLSDFIISDLNGVIVKPLNKKDYIDKIVSLLNDPAKMQNLSAMAYNYARANFSLDYNYKLDLIMYEDELDY